MVDTTVGTTEAAFLLGLCTQRIRQLLAARRIIGAVKVGRFWRIPLFNGIPKIKVVNRTRNSTWRHRPQEAKTIIHVHRQKVTSDSSSNKEAQETQHTSKLKNSLVILVKQGKHETECHSAVIDGPSRLVYQPLQALSSGARLWIEVEPNISVRTQVFASV